MTNFALPDLRGRIAIGADAANPIGSAKGAETVTVTRSELPGAGQQPLSDDQPSLAITYLIATNGIFPAPFNNNSFDPFDQTLGQIAEFAGDFAPSGWALADGQLLSIDSQSGVVRGDRNDLRGRRDKHVRAPESGRTHDHRRGRRVSGR